MSLISYGTGETATPPDAIANNGFWPDLDAADFRDAERIDSTATEARFEQALRVAMADINRQLAPFQEEQQANGVATAAEIPRAGWQCEGHHKLLYRRAVYATALASLLERYRDYSATGEGDERGEAKDLAADDYRRDARWAVSEILDESHAVVELI
ncbi:head completion/stabilization protein [Halomonas llamarensis]|uniref:Head completion/stabilization protein n=1 Tax=Halomonas llamarensis TaxID=2945104 RepID=A0ABT0SRS1_9GAMM|nr:head completion/stabilization protein [Halomonas llamarensis]MCL7930427.1 head completion/stabilization protein [Halomonas llamarensis]